MFVFIRHINRDTVGGVVKVDALASRKSWENLQKIERFFETVQMPTRPVLFKNAITCDSTVLEKNRHLLQAGTPTIFFKQIT